MKTRIIVFIMAFNVFATFGQKLELEKASPFTAVKWENKQPIVQFNKQWYHFEKLDNFSKKEILDFCKKEFGHKWQKRFSEDLVEVLKGLNYIPNKQVDLELSKDGISKTYRGIFTLENRQSCLMYNSNNRVSKSTEQTKTNNREVKTISKTQAIEDLKQFKNILDYKSSYAQLTDYDYSAAIKELEVSVFRDKENVNIDRLANAMGKIMSEIGDRHSSIKNESFDKNEHKAYNLRLPFGITVLEHKLIAVKQIPKKDNYMYYFESFPYIKSINGINTETLISTYNFRDKKAPKDSKLTRGANAIQKYGSLLFKNNNQVPESIKVIFTNGEIDRIEDIKLTTEQKGFTSKLARENFMSMMNVRRNKQFDSLSKTLNDNIGYIKIPMMFHPQEIEGLEHFIETEMNEFTDTKALIIDIRNNPGGGREILQTFASYLIQSAQSPWIANVAYLRTDDVLTTDEESMSGRYLYTYNSDKFSTADREAINLFNKNFETQKAFEKTKFSSPFYMTLHAGNVPYSKPVYILVNENSFSAATVFTSAFKGLPNIKIVGVTTDGSSGNSRKVYLNNSNIRVKVSTMLSFQRNGKTLDGNGTEPDIYIPIDSEQIFTGKDTQLEKLVRIINKKN